VSHLAPLVSIVIPVRDDSAALSDLLQQLPASGTVEILVSAAGDASGFASIRCARPDVIWLNDPPGRGRLPGESDGSSCRTGTRAYSCVVRCLYR
jgi:hypothetical protein